MSSFHVRYGWIARERLAALFPASSAIDQLADLAQRREHLLCQARAAPASGGPGAARDLDKVWRFLLSPRPEAAPRRKVLAGARTRCRDELDRAVVAWAAEAADAVRACEGAEPVPYVEIGAFLQALAQTDFPACLLLSHQDLALRVFVSEGRHTALAQDLRAPGRRAARVLLTCLGYALAGVGRMAPRDAWIGVGTGVFDQAAAGPLRVAGERLALDPDLSWIGRHWGDLLPLPLEAGLSPWAYLERLLAAQHDPALRVRYAQVLTDLAPVRAGLTGLDFSAAQRLLQAGEAILRATTSPERWGADPHRFWVTRHLPGERALPEAERAALLDTLEHRREALRARGLLEEGPVAQGPRAPYPLRVQASLPAAVLLAAAEFFDWVIACPALPLKVPEGLPEGCGAVIRLDETGWRAQNIDPNPRRAAERFALLEPVRPRFCAEPADEAYEGLAPPPGLLDNRLVRLAAPERAATSVRPGEQVLFYSTLLTAETAPLLALELRAPRYAAAPDLVPIFFDEERSVPVSFGRVCGQSCTWLLMEEDVRTICARVRRAHWLAAVYLLEVHTELLRPDWLEVLIDGQPTALYVHSVLSWFYLLHRLREARGPVALVGTRGEQRPPLIVDAEGAALPAQVIVR